MQKNVTVKGLHLTSALSTLAFLAVAVPAHAQDASTPTGTGNGPATGSAITTAGTPTQAGEEIVVTGSRIARPDLQAAVPVAVVSAERIQQNGSANVQDVLNQLPSMGSNFGRTSSNFSNTGNGQATLNLRNLGDARTLVLINGRRTLGIAGTSAVDVNNIPADLISRVEVVTGGASAVYGSEAIAGVVNFVLNDRFEGFKIKGQATISDKGDAPRQYVSITGGHSFLDDRAHLVANFSYDNDHGLRSRNRSFSSRDIPNRSSYAQQGLFDATNLNDPNAGATFSPATGNTFTFNPTNGLKGYQGANIDGFNRNAVRLLSVPVERYLGTVLGNFEVSDALNFYAEGSYAHTNSNAALEPSAIDNVSPGGKVLNFDGSDYDGIPITSPYVPAEIRARAIANGATVLQFRRRSNDIFDRSNTNKRDFYRGVFGAKGNFAANWGYDVYYEHSYSRDHTSAQAIYTPNYGAALSNEIGPDGQVRCSDPAARAAGCVPINIFGYNTVSAAAAGFLQNYTGPTRTVTLVDGNTVQLTNGSPVNYNYLAKTKQDVISGSIHGDLFSIAGGPVTAVVGGEYRREKSSEVFDPFTQAGLSSGNQITNTTGKFNVKEAFAEVLAPIVEDRPGIHFLGLEGAARYADYSTVGNVFSWKAGGSYAPTRDIRFRAIYSRATRAPNIGELFASLSQTFPAVTDPCDQGGGQGDGAALSPLAAGCSAVPGVAATVARRGAFAYSTAQIQTIDGLLGGNRNLKEETANTITAGAVITPTFLRNFSMTVDYYRIKVKNAIGQVGQQISVSQCLSGGDPLFCGNVIRDANGFITRVNDINLNTGAFLVEGIDVDTRYTLELDSIANNLALDIQVQWNHQFKQRRTPFPGGPVQNEIKQADCYSCGRLGAGFRDKVFSNFTLRNSNVALNYQINYYGPLSDNLDGSTPVITPIRRYFYHNAQIKFLLQDRFEMYVGVNNIFDKLPPVFGDTNPVTFPGTQTSANTYDLFGRMIYVGASVRF